MRCSPRGRWSMLLLIGLCPTMDAASAGRTFYKDLLPILENRCQECHRRGEIAPMPLVTYEETRPWAKAIREAVLLKKMPPCVAEPGHARLTDQRALSAEEIDTILAWVDQGSLKGNPAEARPPRR